MQPSFVHYEGYTRELAKRSVGPGWASLVDRVFDNLPERVKVIQVKEKFGVLTIYTDANYTTDLNTPFNLIIRDVARESLTICEGCGAPGFHRASAPGTSWVRTLCDTCEEKYQETKTQPWL